MITRAQVEKIPQDMKVALSKMGFNCWCNDCQHLFCCPTDGGGACRNCGSKNWIELTV